MEDGREGGEGHEAMVVHWLTTDNGIDWEPVVPDQPVVLTGGNSETDLMSHRDQRMSGTLTTFAPSAKSFSAWGFICRVVIPRAGRARAGNL